MSERDLPIIRRVKQPVSTGCAVACVAMVAGVSFDKAARAVKRRTTGDLCASFAEMMQALRHMGFTCRMGSDFRARGQRAILMFEWDWAPEVYHCLVWDPAFGGRLVEPDGLISKMDYDYYWRLWRRSGREALVVTGFR